MREREGGRPGGGRLGRARWKSATEGGGGSTSHVMGGEMNVCVGQTYMEEPSGKVQLCPLSKGVGKLNR